MASRHKSPAGSMVEQRILLPQAMLLDWKFERILLNTVRCRQLLTLMSKTELRDLYSKQQASMFKCMSMFYMINSPFNG